VNEVYAFPRTKIESGQKFDSNRTYYRGLSKAIPPKPAIKVLSSVNQVVRIVPMSAVPEKAFEEGTVRL